MSHVTQSETLARAVLVSDKTELIRNMRKQFKSSVEYSRLGDEELKFEYQYYLLEGERATIGALEAKAIALCLGEKVEVKPDIDPSSEIDACFKFCDEVITHMPNYNNDVEGLNKMIRRVNYWYSRTDCIQ